MTVKRERNEEREDVSSRENKKAKASTFFEELEGENDKFPERRKKKKNAKNKITSKHLAPPEWATGSGEQLGKYITNKELVDIESLIVKYLNDNKIEIIDGEIAERKAGKYKNDDAALKMKASEQYRIERLQTVKAAAIKKTEEDLNVEEYFKDSIKIDPTATATATFESLQLNKKLMQAIHSLKYTTPTPIQAATIPVALAGKDVCGCAATGTGKTAAYLLPTIERLLMSGKSATPSTKVLVIVPTRELGVQVFQVCQSLLKYTKLVASLVAGGMRSKTQEYELSKKPDIVIATPGRLLTYIEKLEGFTLEHVQVLVLDEADRILDDYFEEQMAGIIRRCGLNRQTLLFSATMTTEVKRVATAALTNPVKLFINSNTNVAQGLRQEYILMKSGKLETRTATLAFLLIHVFNNNTLVFLPTKILCHRLYVILRLCGLRVGELHSKLPQSARLHNLTQFASGDLRVLLATDLAARGLDIKGVDNVINYQLNSSYEMYVHRVGRTARAGRVGLAVSLVPDDEYKHLKMIKKMSKTAVYERRIDKAEVEKWRLRMQNLNGVCDSILEMERAALKEREALEIKGQISSLVVKNEKKMKHEKELEEQTKKKSELAAAAKAEGMSVKEYLQHKRLQSNAVSNSKKKRVKRFLERQQMAIFVAGTNKKKSLKRDRDSKKKQPAAKQAAHTEV